MDDRAGLCGHDELRFTAVSEGNESIIGAACAACGEVFACPALVVWPDWMLVRRCVACLRELGECCGDPCAGRDLVEPWKMLAPLHE